MCMYVYVCMGMYVMYVWVYYKTIGEVGKIIAQLRWADRYGWVWMGMGLIVPPPLLLSLL